MTTGCSQSQPTQQELSMFDELDAINSKMNDLLFRDLDNYSAEERKKMICEEYTQLYKDQYMPIVLKNSTPEDRQYNEKKLLAELNEIYTEYKNEYQIRCERDSF